MFGKAISVVRDAIHTSDAWLANSSSSHQFCTLASPDGIREICSSAALPCGYGPRLPRSSFGVFDLFFYRAGGVPQPRSLGCRAWC